MVQVGAVGVLAQREAFSRSYFARAVLLLFHVVEDKLVLVGERKLLDLCGLLLFLEMCPL